MPPAVIEQVQARTAQVSEAVNRALFELSKRWFADDAEAAVRAIQRQSAAWAERGVRYATSGDDPPGRGWEGWIAAGQEYLDGVEAVAEMGRRNLLDNIEVTVASTAKDVAAAPARFVSHAATTVGEGADTLVSPIFGKVLVLAAVAGAGVYVYYRFVR
jgi:hypothetical protein